MSRDYSGRYIVSTRLRLTASCTSSEQYPVNHCIRTVLREGKDKIKKYKYPCNGLQIRVSQPAIPFKHFQISPCSSPSNGTISQQRLTYTRTSSWNSVQDGTAASVASPYWGQKGIIMLTSNVKNARAPKRQYVNAVAISRFCVTVESQMPHAAKYTLTRQEL